MNEIIQIKNIEKSKTSKLLLIFKGSRRNSGVYVQIQYNIPMNEPI